MIKPGDWSHNLRLERAFLALEERVRSGAIHDYRQVHPEAFAWHGWDLVPEERLFDLVLPFLRGQLARAVSSMPGIYASHKAAFNPADIRSLQDWHSLPVLMKDDDPQTGERGFREAANADPQIMKPLDAPGPLVVFGSGGSQGRYTPTYVTAADRQREVQAWRRGHAYHGLLPGDTALYTYNTTHKGGQWMQESLLLHGVNVLLRRTEETSEDVLQNLRLYHANVLFTVQQPPEVVQSQAKAAGINLHSLVMASLEKPEYRGVLVPDEHGRKQIEFIFLGGFEIVPYALELSREYLDDTPIATLLGSSEAIPQACSTNPALTPGALCHHNNLHLLQGPHYIEVVKPSNKGWVPAGKGEEGLLVYTSWARDGTLWIRYAPGDAAVRLLDEGECPCGIFSPVIGGVRRANLEEQAELFISGCAAG
jgi:phenylacetate-CoA ligase